MRRLCLLWMGFCLFCFAAQAAVYDCFPFFNEIELLKMRLDELDGVVDYFVLVESAETQRGTEKPFYFAENRHLFEKYLPKIIHVKIDERHPEMGLWQREHYQRNGIARGLKECSPKDIIIISDVDEIPRASLIEEMVKSPKYIKSIMRYGIALEMSIYFYQLNRQTSTKETWGGGPWIGTVFTSYNNVTKYGVQYFRDQRRDLNRIYDGGWHFTWMGGKERIRQKHVSVVEGIEGVAAVPDEEIEKWINNHPVVPIDETFPNYVRKNEAYLRSIGYIADY